AACARARGVTSQLLTFAKGGAPIRRASSIRELVIDCTEFVLAGSTVAPRFNIDPDLWAANVDTNQIGQVVHNLVLNAMQAMNTGGLVDIGLENVFLNTEALPGMSEIASGKYVRLTVRDRGAGIATKHLGRVFDPYFTTKEKGSGLGLA